MTEILDDADGISIMKAVRPLLLSALICPPCSTIIFFAIASPKPEPPVSLNLALLKRQNLSKSMKIKRRLENQFQNHQLNLNG